MKKSIKSSFVAGIVTLSLFTTISYVSCTKTSNDPCTSTICYNGGTCSNAKCTCPSGYDGANCQYSWGDLLAGEWYYVNTYYTATYGMTSITDDPTHFLLSGLTSGDDITCTFSSENTFTFSNNAISSGKGTVSSDRLSINISYTDNNGNETYTLTR